MKIRYSKDALKFLVWDPDFTKVTPEERPRIDEAEASGFIDDEEIDWDNLEKYADE